jgi:hypothetical protein
MCKKQLVRSTDVRCQLTDSSFSSTSNISTANIGEALSTPCSAESKPNDSSGSSSSSRSDGIGRAAS